MDNKPLVNQQNSKVLLTLGFGSVLALLVVLTLIWLSSAEQINGKMEAIVNKHNVKTELISTMRDIARTRAISLHRMAIMEDPFDRDDEYIKFYSQVGNFIHAREKLLQLLTDEQEIKAWDEARIFIINGQKSQEKVINLIVNERLQEANEALLREVIPSQNKVIKQLTVMLDLQRNATNKAVEEARQAYKRTHTLTLSLGAAAVILGFLIAIFVIRRTSMAEITLLRAHEAALEASHLKSEFLAKMSHELRTPLNAVIGYSEMLEEEAKDSGQNQFIPDLQKIRTAGKHLLMLINDVLDLSKIESGRLELHCQNFDIHAMIDEIVVTIEPLVIKNKNTLQVICDPNIGTMYADEMRIRQSLFNLLNNSCKFTENGTVTLNVARKNISGTSWVNFCVTDTGIGMSQDQLNKIFQAFTQGDSSISYRFGGTGLGLAISKRFCELMGGDINVNSQPGVGSAFTIQIPAHNGRES